MRLEQGFDRLSACLHVAQVLLGGLLLLLVFQNLFTDPVLGVQGDGDSFHVVEFALHPVVQVQIWVLEVFAQRADLFLQVD